MPRTSSRKAGNVRNLPGRSRNRSFSATQLPGGGSRNNWWCESSNEGNATNFCNVNNNGNPNNNGAGNANGVPL